MKNMRFRFDELNKGQVVISYDKGSVLWALEQIMYGKKVKRDTGAVYSDSGTGIKREGKETNTISRRLFISNNINATDFKICREPKFKVGDWVADIKDGCIYNVIKIDYKDNKYHVRKPDKPTTTILYWHALEHNCELYPLEPNFSNAEPEDKAFNILQGYTEIDCIEKDNGTKSVSIFFPVKSSTIANANEICNKDGRRDDDDHPILFHNHEQARAYFLEVFRKLDEELQDDN